MLRRVLLTFGNGDCGRLGHGCRTSTELPLVVRAVVDLQVAGVAAGGAHTAVVTQDGSVLTFGLNDRGQLGHSAGEGEVLVPQEVPLPERGVAVAAGHFHTLCLTESGSVWAWGCNRRGQLGVGSASASVPAPSLLTSLRGLSIAGIAAGAEHSLAVTTGGEAYSWGCGGAGRLGHGASSSALKRMGVRDEAKPRLMRALETQQVRQVSAGHMHSAVATKDGRVFMFGDNRFYQLGLAADDDSSLASPREIPALHGVAHVACGGLHTLAALHGDRVAAWGVNEHGCIGLGRKGPLQARTPSSVPGLEAELVAAGWKHSAAIDAGGRLFTFGWGGSQGTALSLQEGGSGGGQLGLGNEFDYWQPAHVAHLQLERHGGAVPQFAADGRQAWGVLHASCGLNHTAAVVELSTDVLL